MKNPLGFIITIEGFPYDSDANRVANYWYKESSGDIDMIATFMQEAMFNKNAKSHCGAIGICQLMPNKTNLVWINDERWGDIMFQAKVCLEKRQAVPEPSKIRQGWWSREKHKSKILYIN